MTVFISGPITKNENYKSEFSYAEKILKELGHIVINPSFLPLGLDHHQYMHMCFAMIDICDIVVLIKGWENSQGSNMEFSYALNGKKIVTTLEKLLEESELYAV